MHYVEPATGKTYPFDTPRWCGDDGDYLELSPSDGLRRDDIVSSLHSLWRYVHALPLTWDDAVSMGEGWTPLIDGTWQGSLVQLKLEFMMPTGSFKDRGTSVLVSYLKQLGIQHVLEDSSGNAGASLSAYAARAGIRCRILVPETASYNKIVQIAACGAEVIAVPGSRQYVAEEAQRQAADIFYASHNWHPAFIEGIKTLAYELWEQMDFSVPDNIVVPLGYGSNVLGCQRGFDELKRSGQIARSPRIFGVQAANCAPLQAAFERGLDVIKDVEVRLTMAEGVASARPTRAREVVAAVRASQGTILAVTESEIQAALEALAKSGLFVEPTSAVAAAGLTRLMATGTITAQQRTVLVLTGSGLKAGTTIGQALGIQPIAAAGVGASG
jgi:threonine synthase